MTFLLWEGTDFEHLALTGAADDLVDAISLHFDAPEGPCAQVDQLIGDTSICRVTIAALPA